MMRIASGATRIARQSSPRASVSRPLQPLLTSGRGLATNSEGKKRLHLSVLQSTPEKHAGTVIFLHGLGDTGEGWYPVFEMLQPRLPHIKVILPTAPARPVTINGGMVMPAWYDIQTLSDEDRLAIECEGLEENKKQIRKIIKDEIESGTPANRIIVGGFSQGGALALHAGYAFEKPLAGVLALSAYLPQQAQLKQQMEETNFANKGTELFMCHGSDDPVVLEQWGRKSYEILRDSLGVTGRFIVYKGMEHSASPQELNDLATFIERKIPKDDDKSENRARAKL